MRIKDRLILGACVCAPAIIIDRLIKAAVASSADFTLIKGVVSITETRNTGAAFSIMSSSPLLAGILSGLILLVLMLYALCGRSAGKFESAALFLIIAGGLSNLCDRIFYGAVTDYIRLLFVSFAVFNFADICVCAGVVMLILSILFSSKAQKE